MEKITLPVIIGDTGTHFQIYNPRNLDTYFIVKKDFFALATTTPSMRFRGVKKEILDNMIKEINNLEKSEARNETV